MLDGWETHGDVYPGRATVMDIPEPAKPPENRTLKTHGLPGRPQAVQHRSTATLRTANDSEKLPPASDLPQRPRATSAPGVRIEGVRGSNPLSSTRVLAGQSTNACSAVPPCLPQYPILGAIWEQIMAGPVMPAQVSDLACIVDPADEIRPGDGIGHAHNLRARRRCVVVRQLQP
jgi:hypothetical protein